MKMVWMHTRRLTLTHTNTHTHTLLYRRLATSYRDTGVLSKFYGSKAVPSLAAGTGCSSAHRDTTSNKHRLCLPRGQADGPGNAGTCNLFTTWPAMITRTFSGEFSGAWGLSSPLSEQIWKMAFLCFAHLSGQLQPSHGGHKGKLLKVCGPPEPQHLQAGQKCKFGPFQTHSIRNRERQGGCQPSACVVVVCLGFCLWIRGLNKTGIQFTIFLLQAPKY